MNYNYVFRPPSRRRSTRPHSPGASTRSSNGPWNTSGRDGEPGPSVAVEVGQSPFEVELQFPASGEFDLVAALLVVVLQLPHLLAGIVLAHVAQDGFGDGLMLRDEKVEALIADRCMFGILQATRARISKTEYISCPSCGRTLYDLQTTIARIKEATSRLKGLKIGIMGCIVNGPGEMADADYGYVGAGRGQISLYKGKECVLRNIPEDEAVERLVQLIKENGDWVN